MHLPQVQLYWSRGTRTPSVADHMTRNRFHELRNHLHFVDTSATTARQKEDKLHLVRPIVDCFQAACRALPRSKELSIDEQMIPFSGRCGFRQYLPSKPNPLGLKNFVLASPDGLVLDFVVYTGKNTVDADDSKLYGLGGAVVKKLATTITDDRAHIFTDRYFTGLRIMDHLLERTVFLTGTANANRTEGAAANLPSDKAMKRGDSACLVRDDGEVCVVKWKDNKSVLLMTSAVGCDPVATCMRWCKEAKKKVPVPQPAIVAHYNKFMGGVDLVDRYVSYYRINIKTRKWTVRFFTHFLDLAVCNSWILYQRDAQAMGIPKKQVLSQLQFKQDIAETLIRENPMHNRKERSDPPATDNSRPVQLPNLDTRRDRFDHFPEFCSPKNAMRCRNENCKGKTRVKCTKCNVFLCLQGKNCFVKFHNAGN
nr:piggyBac transposable element-derived protein 3-like [Rhipicephalus microplus]